MESEVGNNNKLCNACGSAMTKNGFDRKGERRYRCSSQHCNKTIPKDKNKRTITIKCHECGKETKIIKYGFTWRSDEEKKQRYKCEWCEKVVTEREKEPGKLPMIGGFINFGKNKL